MYRWMKITNWRKRDWMWGGEEYMGAWWGYPGVHGNFRKQWRPGSSTWDCICITINQNSDTRPGPTTNMILRSRRIHLCNIYLRNTIVHFRSKGMHAFVCFLQLYAHGNHMHTRFIQLYEVRYSNKRVPSGCQIHYRCRHYDYQIRSIDLSAFRGYKHKVMSQVCNDHSCVQGPFKCWV